MAHHCHATDCQIEVPPEMLMCKRHWFMVPYMIRTRVWRAYRHGQCDDMQVTHEYCEAAKAAVITVARKEGKTPNVRLYDMLDPNRG